MSLKDDALEIKNEVEQGANTADRIGGLFEKIVTKNGWASYSDTQYINAGSAFTLTADTDTILPNNAGNIVDSQIPYDITEFYNSTSKKILGKNGDSLDIMIYFKAIPTNVSQWLDVWIDIDGSIGELYRQTFTFPKGTGEERGILYALSSAYTLGTWEANGGIVYVRSNATLYLHSFNFNFDRTHKAI